MTPGDLARLTALRHALHRAPEISGAEARTAATVAGLLREMGADRVLTGLGGHGVVAVFDSGVAGPSVAIRCELDALPIPEETDLAYASETPGHGHLCGHDGHMVIVLAVGEALAARRPARGRAILIFQPAEETGKGAMALRADPRFAEVAPDTVLSLHNLPGLPLGMVELCARATNCASRGMAIRLFGKTSHAAAPQDGLSPAGVMAALMPRLAALGPGGALDDGFALTTLTHARLGEPTFGVAPGEGALWVTLRTVTDARMATLMGEAEALVRAHAEPAGLRVEISYDDVFEACTNHPAAVDLLAGACRAGDVPLVLTEQPQKFSEDFGQFGKGAEAAMLWLGAGVGHPQLHNPDYDFPDALIPVGAGIFERALRSVLGTGPVNSQAAP
ncbi:amidohydrolase [Ruegeria pomeroyi]|uniref:Amidohydrolase family protein n=2 Tax=Ruegeria pomeroyi TaxID=89184 RepID=Q5LRM4_RUEPO|nr:amidohydrolase [Ruegeria pomeroyi]AAV95372.1 amidohydrolase family protein [Ruegeria pomeroyi DSS-3]NVK96924.1 amidohydrolase [Ruegeria pomeroyi]NVL03494.1 amidohydrolase [Ruegeria pomeroyi]QWV08939.1 amidohydrolase [Ruegeria pomeroyi]